MSTAPRTHVMTLRVPTDLAENMAMVARIDGIPVSELIKDAIQAHIHTRRADAAFQGRLRARIAADQTLLDRLEP